MDLRLGIGGVRLADIGRYLALTDAHHLSCELLPIAIEQRNAVSRPGPEHAAQMLGDVAFQDHSITGGQRLVSE